MSYDYFLERAAWLGPIIAKYNDRLSELEKQRRDTDPRKRKDINQNIASEKQKLLEHPRGDIGDEVSRILSTQLLEDTSLWWFCDLPRKEDARKVYIAVAESVVITEPGKVDQDIDFRPDFTRFISPRWLGLQIHIELLTPWYSKDDRVFHVLDNPVRKDRVFGVPCMSAASWKGLLRWACRMQAGLREHLGAGKRFEEWNDPDWILHLFGNEKGEEQDFHQGALVFYPTWFDRIGFEVINPHSRERRAGTQPIYYEVVPGRRPKGNNQQEFKEGGKGTLYLLYAPWPGMKPAVDPMEFLPKLLEAIETLLTSYGISAKRTVGWGTAKIMKWKAFRKGEPAAESDGKEELLQQIQGWFQTGGTS